MMLREVAIIFPRCVLLNWLGLSGSLFHQSFSLESLPEGHSEVTATTNLRDFLSLELAHDLGCRAL